MFLLRKIAFPFSLLYAVAVCFRNKLFDIGFFASKKFETPVICVGNLSVGGTGKTPMIEFLIRILQDDYKVAVLSRGYKRKSKGYVIASPENTVADLGDEPYQVYHKFSKISVAVDADRSNGIRQLEASVKPDVILLDDAFQHRKVTAGMNILLTSFDELYVDDWYVPTGNLRDGKSQSKRAHFIIVTKCPRDLSSKECNAMKQRLAPKPNQQVLFSYLDYDDMLTTTDNRVSLETLVDEKITLVTGIANPKPLVKYLKNKNLSFDHLVFRDHHFFSPKEIEQFNSRKIILTTEKDYARLRNKVDNLFYLAVAHAFVGDGKECLKKGLKNLMKPIF